MDFKNAVKTPKDLSLWRSSIAKEYRKDYGSIKSAQLKGLPLTDDNREGLIAYPIAASAFEEARLIYVSSEMCKLVDATVDAMTGVNVYDLVPTKTGLVWFEPEHQTAGTEGRELLQEMRGFLWDFRDESNPQLSILWDIDYYEYLYEEEAPEDVAYHKKRFGKSPGSTSLRVEQIVGLEDYLRGGLGAPSVPGSEEVEPVLETIVRNLAATLSLMNSKNIPNTVEQKIFIPGGKVKGKVVKAFKDVVSVVNIRHIEHREAATEKGSVLTCRFIVGGHYRNQPYKSSGEVKRIFIDPYIKGPADAPLKVSRPVYKL